MIYIGADHRGFEFKKFISEYLEMENYVINDLGARELDKKDDFNDYAEDVAKYTRISPENRGILICGSGVGMTIVANKFQGIRCGLCLSEDMAKAARNDDGINILALAADYLTKEEAIKIVKAFLITPFSFEEKYLRRMKKILDLENYQKIR